MAKGGIPVVLVDNGLPVIAGNRGMPVTIVGSGGGAGAPAIVPDGSTVALWNASDDSRGNGSAFVNMGFLTAVRLPPQNDVVGDGATVPLSKEDNTGLLAMVTAHVPADTNTFESVALPHNYAVIQDGQSDFNVTDFGSGGGSVAVVARVSSNNPGVQLANSTTKIAINAAPAQVTAGSKTVGITLAVNQGAWQPFPLVNATDAIVSNGDALTVPVTGTYTTTATLTVAGGVITGITLS